MNVGLVCTQGINGEVNEESPIISLGIEFSLNGAGDCHFSTESMAKVTGMHIYFYYKVLVF